MVGAEGVAGAAAWASGAGAVVAGCAASAPAGSTAWKSATARLPPWPVTSREIALPALRVERVQSTNRPPSGRVIGVTCTTWVPGTTPSK